MQALSIAILVIVLGTPLAACTSRASGYTSMGLDADPDGNTAGSGNTGNAGGRAGDGAALMTDGGGTDFDDGSTRQTDAGRCGVRTTAQPIEGYSHVLECTPLTFGTNPPSSGNHFLYWAAFGVYDFPLPRGYWVHNLEHGTIVVTYNCPNGCAEDLARATSWLAALTPDPYCVAQGTMQARAILTPDPKLDVPWAASAWGFTLRAGCFDPAAFSSFYDDHVAHGRETTCLPGLDFRNPDGSRADTLPADCGD